MDTEDLRRLAGEAGFIFRGKLLPHRPEEALSIPAEVGEALTAEIVEVLHSTKALRGLAGQDVTVVSKRAAALRERHALIFFTDCVALGERIVVREIGHAEDSAETSHALAEALREVAERPLRTRVAGAELIVTGEVLESRALERAFPPKSEHDPEWWIARVAVQSVLKGRKPKGEVEVLFANSMDIAWYRSPKLHRGSGGIFILRRLQEGETPQDAPRSAYQATDPLDFLSAERLAEVERAVDRDRGSR